MSSGEKQHLQQLFKEVLQQAHEAAREISDLLYLRSEALTAIVEAYAAIGDFEAACEAVREIPALHLRGKALTAIVEAYAAKGDFEAARKAVEETIPYAWARSEALAAIAKAIAAAIRE